MQTNMSMTIHKRIYVHLRTHMQVVYARASRCVCTSYACTHVPTCIPRKRTHPCADTNNSYAKRARVPEQRPPGRPPARPYRAPTLADPRAARCYCACLCQPQEPLGWQEPPLRSARVLLGCGLLRFLSHIGPGLGVEFSGLTRC